MNQRNLKKVGNEKLAEITPFGKNSVTAALKSTYENVVAGIVSLLTLGPSFASKRKYLVTKTNMLAC